MIINTKSFYQLNEMYSVNYLGIAFYFWMVVKAQRDRMKPATNKIFAKQYKLRIDQKIGKHCPK